VIATPGRASIFSRRPALWRDAADILRPKAMMRPSDWAEKYVILTKEQSPKRPGPFRCDYKPWTRAIHDLAFDDPTKKGFIVEKPAQSGFTRAVLNSFGCYADTNPAPMLFLISDRTQAGHFAAEHWDPVVKKIPHVRALFERAKLQGRRDLLHEKPFIGGRVDFAGAGSVSSVTARTYVRVAIDEYEVFMDNFPDHRAGSGFTLAEGRTKAVESISCIVVWSHPRRANEGIDDLFQRLSDQQHWVFDCPHCHERVVPEMSLIHFGQTEDGPEGPMLDPDSAVLRCPHCACVITDAERSVAVWERGTRPGATGRFESVLEPEEAKKRRYGGRAIHGLADPAFTVQYFAVKLAGAKSDGDRMAVYNIDGGEPFRSSSALITSDIVEKCVKTAATITVPGGRLGCQFMTVGVDVQYPLHRPTLYCRASCWSASGMAYVVAYHRVSGLDALAEWLRTMWIPREGENNNPPDHLWPRVCTLDYGGSFSGMILDFCRLPITHAHSGGRIKLLPVKHQASVKGDCPAVMPGIEKRTDPRRPNLGAIDSFYLHRHTWLDRELRRWEQDRITVLCPVPPELTAHMTANQMAPVKDREGWGNPNQEWTLIKNRRDDWAQAGAYDEAGAALVLGLDRLYERAYRAGKPRAEGEDEDRRGQGGDKRGWFEKSW
jgi:hypothetical protein